MCVFVKFCREDSDVSIKTVSVSWLTSTKIYVHKKTKEQSSLDLDPTAG